MFRSIQWTLQLWHACLLAVVLIGFGVASHYAISRSRYQQFDTDLERSVQLLAAGFHPPRLPETAAAEVAASSSDPWHGLLEPEFEVPAALAPRFSSGQSRADYYVIWNREGRIMRTSHADVAPTLSYPGTLPQWYPHPRAPSPPQIRKRGEFHEAYVNGPLGTRILLGMSVRPVQLELRRLAFLLSAIGCGVLVIGLMGGWIVSLRVLRPIQAITAVAQDISASNLSRRIEAAEIQSELGSLAGVLNEMFARLDAAFQHQVRFTADASHELRTPLSVIHTHVQLALSRDRSADEYRKTLETCLRASSRMKDLVDSLLLLAGADAGRLTLKREVMDLRTIVEGCVAMVAPLAEAKHVGIEADLCSAELIADASRLAQVTTNLLTNAIRYNRSEGRVQVALAINGPHALLTIADTGVGIPAENQPHVFERFYRVDKARSREEGGSGLGLAICKTIVEAHHGTITFHSELGRGTTFEVRLPLAGLSTTG